MNILKITSYKGDTKMDNEINAVNDMGENNNMKHVNSLYIPTLTKENNQFLKETIKGLKGNSAKTTHIQPLSLSTLSSMNYLFLKRVTGKLDNEYVDIALAEYLTALNLENIVLTSGMSQAIKSEIQEGSYFESKNIQQIDTLVKNTILTITGVNDIDTFKTVYHQYMQIIRELDTQ